MQCTVLLSTLLTGFIGVYTTFSGLLVDTLNKTTSQSIKIKEKIRNNKLIITYYGYLGVLLKVKYYH